jgi:(R,R)-butanediol dehydrogenase/meso-butanediol dehydrogenase/diacetyl reductase
MRAAVFHQPGSPLTIEDRQAPSPGPHEVVLRVAYCGICGSDLHATEPNPFPLDRGTILGHEFSGVVARSGVADFTAGDRVIALPLRQCDDCLARGTGCKDGLGILCPRNRIIGMSEPVGGGYAEYVSVPAAQLVRVPDSLDLRRAALTEPLAVGLHAVAAAGSLLGARVLVIGAGPIGLAVTIFAGLAGARGIAVSELGAERRTRAEVLGAVGIDPTAEPLGPIAERALGGPPDLIFECVGAPGVLRQVMDLAPLRGRIIVVGVCRQADAIMPRVGIRKELSLRFVLGYDRAEFELVLDLLAQGRIDADTLISGVIALDAVPAMFEALRRPGPHAKVLIQPSLT